MHACSAADSGRRCAPGCRTTRARRCRRRRGGRDGRRGSRRSPARDSRRCGRRCRVRAATSSGKFDDELHAHGPVAADGGLRACRIAASSCRPTAPTGPSPTTVSAAWMSMPGMKPAAGLPALSTPWSARRMPVTRSSSMSGLRNRRAGPDLHHAGGHELRADPLVELADGEHEAVVLVQERRERRAVRARGARTAAAKLERADSRVGRAQGERAAAGAEGIEQVEHLLAGDGRGHGNLRRVEIGKAGANAARARDDAGDAEAEVVGAFVADHLQRHVRARRRFRRRGAVGSTRRARAW